MLEQQLLDRVFMRTDTFIRSPPVHELLTLALVRSSRPLLLLKAMLHLLLLIHAAPITPLRLATNSAHKS